MTSHRHKQSVVEEPDQRPEPVVEEVAQRPQPAVEEADPPVVEEVAQRPSRDPGTTDAYLDAARECILDVG
ncbi:MAG TPA: hypothetical protein VNS46_08765, partial [Nocardioides sp.]|nr:hypothetical protein [Nocardioides sp.]